MSNTRWKVGKSMIYSMTGYGRYELEANERKILIEISSVNHRYLDLNIRMPRILMHFEEGIRKIVKEKITRGKIELAVTMQSAAKEDLEVVLNETLGEAYLSGLRTLGAKFGLEDDLKLSALMNVNDLVSIQKQTVHQEAIEEQLEKALTGAIEAFLLMRQKEGEVLKKDILMKCEALKEMIHEVEVRSPEVVVQYRNRLVARLEKLFDEAPIDENRIATEIALFADKCAIDEEVTRLKSHIIQLGEILQEGGVVGRKLDFLMQEMNREANTIGSKANDYDITKIVVLLKTEIEKVREQVQNVE